MVTSSVAQRGQNVTVKSPKHTDSGSRGPPRIKMNDLFTSGSFKKYAAPDLKHQVALDGLKHVLRIMMSVPSLMTIRIEMVLAFSIPACCRICS
jgi:hypothetical protein